MNRDQLLLAEWQDIRDTLRYFGNKRFAQLTVFIAATGLMIDTFLEPTTQIFWVFQAFGVVLSILFWIMEHSSVTYWQAFAERGEAIELDAALQKSIRLMSEARPKERWLWSGTRATYGLYAITLLFWVSSIWWR